MDINIKRQAQLDPATIVRCGHTGSRQAFPPELPRNSFRSSLLDKLILSICLLGGHRAFSVMTCVMANGHLSQRGSECAQQTFVRRGCGVQSAVYFTSPAVVNAECKLTSAENGNELYTPCTVHVTVGLGNTCKTVEKEPQWMNVNFSQCFLQPLTRTRAHHLPPHLTNVLLCPGHADHLG